jgi:hypothetical protein
MNCEEGRLEAIRRSMGDRLSRQLWSLQSGRLCEEARRRTGLRDFGDPPVEPALSILVNSLELEADLHPLGRFLIRVHLRELLETRLRLAQAWSRRSRPWRSRQSDGPCLSPACHGAVLRFFMNYWRKIPKIRCLAFGR